MNKVDSEKNYKLKTLSLLNDFIIDKDIGENNREDQEKVLSVIFDFCEKQNFKCNILGIDFGFNVAEYKVQLLSDREKDDGISKESYFDKKAFYISFIRTLMDTFPARTSSLKVINDIDAPMEMFLIISVPNDMVRAIPLKKVLLSKGNHFNCFFACDRFSNPLTFNCEGGLNLLIGSNQSKLLSGICTAVVGLTCNYSPSELQMILVDEGKSLSAFNGMPHLIFGENICDLNLFYQLLQWIQGDFERLNSLFNSKGCKNFNEYNLKAEKKLPRRVVIISDFVCILKKYDVFSTVIIEEFCNLILKAQTFGYCFLSGAVVNKSYRMQKFNSFIANKFAFRIEGELQSRLNTGNTDCSWLMPSNDGYYCNENQRIIPCFATQEEIEMVVEFLKNSYNIAFDKLSYEQIVAKSKSGYMSQTFIEQNIAKRRVIESVRTALKIGYVAHYVLSVELFMPLEVAKNVLQECIDKKYLKKASLEGAFAPAITIEDFEKIFKEKY